VILAGDVLVNKMKCRLGMLIVEGRGLNAFEKNNSLSECG
jgi:hypothetical protein